MEFEIVRIGPESAALLERVADVFDEPIRPDRVAAYVGEPNHLMLVAVVDGLVVGQVLAVVHRHPDKATELYVDDLGVAEAHRRHGVATALLRELVRLGREDGCEEIWVATEHDNVAALGLYESLGLSMRSAAIFEADL
jgi:ribosomal protein S18 acetylase RimI-like enzyme